MVVKVSRFLRAGAVVVSTALVQGQHVSAAIVDLEAAQQANASLTNQWTFAGGSTVDQKGSLDLNQVDAATPGSISYADDRATFSNNNGDALAGSSLRTNAGVAFPDNMTLELIVTPLAGAGAEDRIISGITWPTPGIHRFYFSQNGDSLTMRVGEGIDITVLATESFVAGNDYYVAMNFAFDDEANTWTLNAFVGNVTTGEGVTQTVTNVSSPASGSPLFGDTLDFARHGNDGHDIASWSGSLDAVALYSTELSSSAIEANYAAAIEAVSEPSSSSSLLMGMSIAGMGLIGGRYGRNRTSQLSRGVPIAMDKQTRGVHLSFFFSWGLV